MKNLNTILVAALAASAFQLAHAAGHQSPDSKATPAAAMVGAADMTDGEVRKIDKGAGKITLKHGEIKNLDMPGMTMVFRVKDAAMLDQLKAGDKVSFRAEKADGAIVVTDIQTVK
ncbi:MAG: copper-binding protein [Pseudomonadota bacterium]